jgi:ribosomal protein S18 acetylase RimI-like enzyme
MPEPGTLVATLPTARGEIVVRYPQWGDAPMLLDYINALSRERTFLLVQGEQLTLAQEEEWLRQRLEEIVAGDLVYLMAVAGDRTVGGVNIARGRGVTRHIGDFGIAIAADHRGLGLGTALLRLAIAEAERRMEGLRLITLHVFANNHLAHALYRKHGFVEYGRLPGGIRHREEHVDAVYMYRPAGSAQQTD